MSRYRRLIFGLVVVGIAAAFTVWRPWQKPPPPLTIDAPTLDPRNAAKNVTLVIVRSGGEACTVTISGGDGQALSRSTFKVSAGESRSPTFRVAGPFTLRSITIEHGGQTHQQELNLTIPGGQAREIWINAEDRVEVRPG